MIKNHVYRIACAAIGISLLCVSTQTNTAVAKINGMQQTKKLLPITHASSGANQAHYQTQANPIKKPWTFLVYMARDNNLSNFGTLNISQMTAINNPYINILVYDCNKIGGKKVAQKIVVTHGKATVVETVPNIDSGSQDTFTKACLWAVQNFPSDKLAIVAWNHGSGPLNRYPFFHNYLMRGFCYDDTTGNYLDDIKLMNALKTVVKARNNKKIDLFGFDACLMADIEIYDALAPYVAYAVASQETIPGTGWPYDRILASLDARGLTTAPAFAGQIVHQYALAYANQSNTTLAAVELSHIKDLNKSIDALSNLLINVVSTDYVGTARNTIVRAINEFFAEPTYMDFFTFCNQLREHIGAMKITDKKLESDLRICLHDCLRTMQTTIISNYHSNDLTSAMGMSLYFPQGEMESSYLQTYFAQHSKWLQFIQLAAN